jgi:hypothetical protein
MGNAKKEKGRIGGLRCPLKREKRLGKLGTVEPS